MRDATEPVAEFVFGQSGLIPGFAEMPTLPYSTGNARSEDMSQKATYKDPWRCGKRCIISALSFEGRCWETGRNVWWRFSWADGKPWGIAGLWNTWSHKALATSTSRAPC
jgi:putative SOS response-associated peptidase YedK